MTHIHILVLNLFVDEVCCPDSDSVVVDGEEFRVTLVVEGYLVGSVSANWVSAESLASGNLNMKIRFE